MNTERYSIGDKVYYNGYLAKVLALAGRTRFRKIPKYLIEPYPQQLSRVVVKATKLLRAHV